MNDGRTPTRSRWLRCVRHGPSARTTLVCFPHAGGAASFFGPWGSELPVSIEMYAVQYPGREDRIAEECMSNMADLAPAVATALSPLTDRPFALFGHSMGAAVAYEVARLLRPEPVCLFVSGRHSPLEQVGNDVRLRDDAGVLAELARLGGTPTELLGDPELYEMVVPTMRSDFTIEETYQRHEGRRLDCPIVALVGTEDPDVTAAQATRWKELTSGPFRLETYPGDHFYLVPQHRRVIETVTTELARLAP